MSNNEIIKMELICTLQAFYEVIKKQFNFDLYWNNKSVSEIRKEIQDLIPVYNSIVETV